jgi:hypothetical protein
MQAPVAPSYIRTCEVYTPTQISQMHYMTYAILRPSLALSLFFLNVDLRLVTGQSKLYIFRVNKFCSVTSLNLVFHRPCYISLKDLLLFEFQLLYIVINQGCNI